MLMTTMDIKENGIRLMLLGACGASIWSLARLLLHEPRKRTLNKIDLDVRVALLRAVLAPITKLLKRSVCGRESFETSVSLEYA